MPGPKSLIAQKRLRGPFLQALAETENRKQAWRRFQELTGLDLHHATFYREYERVQEILEAHRTLRGQDAETVLDLATAADVFREKWSRVLALTEDLVDEAEADLRTLRSQEVGWEDRVKRADVLENRIGSWAAKVRTVGEVAGLLGRGRDVNVAVGVKVYTRDDALEDLRRALGAVPHEACRRKALEALTEE